MAYVVRWDMTIAHCKFTMPVNCVDVDRAVAKIVSGRYFANLTLIIFEYKNIDNSGELGLSECKGFLRLRDAYSAHSGVRLAVVTVSEKIKDLYEQLASDGCFLHEVKVFDKLIDAKAWQREFTAVSGLERTYKQQKLMHGDKGLLHSV